VYKLIGAICVIVDGSPHIDICANCADPIKKKSLRFKTELALNRQIFILIGSSKLAQIRGVPAPSTMTQLE
jgi:hypothetical protein